MGDDWWCAESVVGSGVREVIYYHIVGLKSYYEDLVEYKPSKERKQPDLGPLVAKYQNKPK